MKIVEKLIAFGGLALIGCISLLVSCNPEVITPTPGNYIIQGDQDTGPAFSADGNFIAYLHDDATSNSATAYATGLYFIDRNGNNRKLVLLGVHLDPAWSPDGQWLVFSSLGVIQKCKTNGDSLTTFKGLSNLKYPQFYFPDWSADGKNILFDNPFPSDGGGIFQIASNFINAKRLFGLDPFGRIRRDPDLSPDESQFVFIKAGPEESIGEIYKIDTLGKTEIRLTQNTRYDRSPTWSPDGLRIAWSSNIRLTLMKNDGTGQIEIGYGNTPSWSINNEIVFSHANADYTKEVLYTILPDGSNKKQITF